MTHTIDQYLGYGGPKESVASLPLPKMFVLDTDSDSSKPTSGLFIARGPHYSIIIISYTVLKLTYKNRNDEQRMVKYSALFRVLASVH